MMISVVFANFVFIVSECRCLKRDVRSSGLQCSGLIQLLCLAYVIKGVTIFLAKLAGDFEDKLSKELSFNIA